MGYFRRYKLSDYTAEECRERMRQLEYNITWVKSIEEIRPTMEEWACFRELLARHEKLDDIDDKDIPAAGFGMEEF